MKKDGVHGTFRMVKNPDFAQAVKNLVKHLNLTQDTPIIIMCKGGTRGPWAAKALYKEGFTQVYTQVDGFEGKKRKKGHTKASASLMDGRTRAFPGATTCCRKRCTSTLPPKSPSKRVQHCCHLPLVASDWGYSIFTT